MPPPLRRAPLCEITSTDFALALAVLLGLAGRTSLLRGRRCRQLLKDAAVLEPANCKSAHGVAGGCLRARELEAPCFGPDVKRGRGGGGASARRPREGR